MEDHDEDHNHYQVTVFDAFGVADTTTICEDDLSRVTFNFRDKTSYVTVLLVPETEH